MRDPPKVVVCLLWRHRDCRYVQPTADHARDILERHTLFGDRVIAGSRGTLIDHEPVELGSIEPVHRGPTVAVTRIGRDPLLTCDANDDRNKAVITIAMDRARQTDH